MTRDRPRPTKTIAQQCRESGRVGALKGGFHCAASRKRPVTLPDPVAAAKARLREGAPQCAAAAFHGEASAPEPETPPSAPSALLLEDDGYDPDDDTITVDPQTGNLVNNLEGYVVEASPPIVEPAPEPPPVAAAPAPAPRKLSKIAERIERGKQRADRVERVKDWAAPRPEPAPATPPKPAPPQPSPSRALTIIPSPAARALAEASVVMRKGRALAPRQERGPGRVLYSPDAPPEARGVALRTAEKMGDPPFERSALYDRLARGGDAEPQPAALRDPDVAFVERWMMTEAAKRNQSRLQQQEDDNGN